MTKSVKKHEFLLPIARLFTHSESDVYEALPFQGSESFGDESAPVLAAPTTWDVEAIATMAEAACPSIPADLRAIEENTVPSWLWRHQARGSRRVIEADLRDIFNRAVGSAAVRAWKLNLFTNEKHARSFYDETRFAFVQRHIVVVPEIIAGWGLSWAYGLTEPSTLDKNSSQLQTALLTNAAIDAVIGKTKETSSAALWKKLFAGRRSENSKLALRLSDISKDWHSTKANPARAAIDLMALRHNDGTVNINAVRQAARLLTLVLDLHDQADVTIGLANVAPLLMALGLAYDSDAARAMVASLAALVTAECYAASAEMSALRGPSHEFVTNRDAVMRSLRNHCRAVYGDNNDYEKLSVLPAPLPVKNCPDLALAAEAQRRWHEAVELARAFGLRTTQVTDLTACPLLSVLMTSASQGLEPMHRLTTLQHDDSDMHRTVLHPAVGEALARLDYPRAIAQATAHYIVGMHSLHKSPLISHASLRTHGFTDAILEKIESYIPFVDNLRLAVTPWIVGIDFCRTELKIAVRTLESPRFNLLHHLGFTDEDIEAANLYCYGYGSVRNAKILHLRHRSVFACGKEVSAEARMRMAAAVQSFVSGDTGVTVHIPSVQSVERGAEITLSAWRHGIKSFTLVFDATLEETPQPQVSISSRRIKASAQSHAKPFVLPPRSARGAKATSVLVAKKGSSTRRAGTKA